MHEQFNGFTTYYNVSVNKFVQENTEDQLEVHVLGNDTWTDIMQVDLRKIGLWWLSDVTC